MDQRERSHKNRPKKSSGRRRAFGDIVPYLNLSVGVVRAFLAAVRVGIEWHLH